MYELPTSIQIGNTNYKITNNGDFRVIFDCFLALNDVELDEWYRIVAALIIFYEDFNNTDDISTFFEDDVEKAAEGMFNFFDCGQHSPGMKTDYTLIDWEEDSQVIFSAINKVANKEIRLEPYVHWWTFMGYYFGIGESLLCTIVGIRNKIINGKKLEKWELEFKKKNPQYFTWKKQASEKLKEDIYIMEHVWNQPQGGENI